MMSFPQVYPVLLRSELVCVCVPAFMRHESSNASNRASRLSILFTVIRFTWERMRWFLILSAYLFALAWIVMFAQVFWVCEGRDQSWKDQPTPQCMLGLDVAVAQVICTYLLPVFPDLCSCKAAPLDRLADSTLHFVM